MESIIEKVDKQIELDENGGDLNNKIGETNYNTYGSLMTIVKYYGLSYVVVEFDNGYITRSTYNQFKNRKIRSPYDRTICGVGIVGLENIYPNINLEYKKSYDKWRSMITRCYNEKSLKKHTTYQGCSVCDEWLFYPNFKKWYDKN